MELGGVAERTSFCSEDELESDEHYSGWSEKLEGYAIILVNLVALLAWLARFVGLFCQKLSNGSYLLFLAYPVYFGLQATRQGRSLYGSA